jgi:tetratricopeptide (TPR) repeat protein
MSAALGGCLHHAHALGRRPVLSFTRSLGRAGALKRAFPGKSIFLHRNLFHQWASYSGQAAHGNNYFFDKLNDCVHASRHDPIVAMLDDWLSSRESISTDRNNFLLFLLFHLYIYTSAFSAADLIIDSTRVACDNHAREEVEVGLHTLLGRRISLDDAKPSFEMSQLDLKRSQVDMDTVEQFLKIVLPKSLDEACLTFVHQAKNDAFEEWGRNEFYSSGMRGILVSKISELDTVNQRLNDVSTQCNHVVHERDRLETLAQASASKSAEQAEQLETLSQEHDRLSAELDRQKTDYSHRLSDVSTQRDHFAQERDEARGLHLQEVALREQLLHDLTRVQFERDRFASESAAQAERFKTLSQEHQCLSTALDHQKADYGRHVQAVQQHLDIVERHHSLFWSRLAFGALVAHVFLGLARRAARRRDWSTAASWYQALLARAPLNFAAWRQYGNMQREQGHLEDAARAYAITLLRYPQDEEVRGWVQQINRQRKEPLKSEYS